MNVDNIIKDMKSHYVSTNPDRFLELEREKRQREAEAEDFNAQGADAKGSGSGGEDFKKIPKDVKDFIEASAKIGKSVTVEEAERALKVLKNGGRLS